MAGVTGGAVEKVEAITAGAVEKVGADESTIEEIVIGAVEKVGAITGGVVEKVGAVPDNTAGESEAIRDKIAGGEAADDTAGERVEELTIDPFVELAVLEAVDRNDEEASEVFETEKPLLN